MSERKKYAPLDAIAGHPKVEGRREVPYWEAMEQVIIFAEADHSYVRNNRQLSRALMGLSDCIAATIEPVKKAALVNNNEHRYIRYFPENTSLFHGHPQSLGVAFRQRVEGEADRHFEFDINWDNEKFEMTRTKINEDKQDFEERNEIQYSVVLPRKVGFVTEPSWTLSDAIAADEESFQIEPWVDNTPETQQKYLQILKRAMNDLYYMLPDEDPSAVKK
jgi:hypothetical protein